VATVVCAVGLLLAPQWVALSPAWTALWILLTFLACCASHVVVHNHCHSPIFASHIANRGFNLLASVARGHCASDVYLAHNGYHTVHHAEPGVHWSETRTLHERLASRIPAHLDEPSATRYMIRRYLLARSD